MSVWSYTITNITTLNREHKSQWNSGEYPVGHLWDIVTSVCCILRDLSPWPPDHHLFTLQLSESHLTWLKTHVFVLLGNSKNQPWIIEISLDVRYEQTPYLLSSQLSAVLCKATNTPSILFHILPDGNYKLQNILLGLYVMANPK